MGPDLGHAGSQGGSDRETHYKIHGWRAWLDSAACRRVLFFSAREATLKTCPAWFQIWGIRRTDGRRSWMATLSCPGLSCDVQMADSSFPRALYSECQCECHVRNMIVWHMFQHEFRRVKSA